MRRARNKSTIGSLLGLISIALVSPAPARAELVFCKSLSGYIMAREGTCDGTETQVPDPGNTDARASLSCRKGQTTRYAGGRWACAQDRVTVTQVEIECDLNEDRYWVTTETPPYQN